MRSRAEPIPVDATFLQLPLWASRPFSGFTNPGEDYVEQGLDLNALLIRNYPATYLFQASGDAMIGAGIWTGDLLLVDRSKPVEPGSVVIVVLEGEFLVRTWEPQEGVVVLAAEHPDYPPILVRRDQDVNVFGVVEVVLHRPKRSKGRAR